MNPLQATCLLILFLTTSACRPERTETILSPAPSITPKSYLALGDSYTIGQGVSATERFPAQTAQWLQQKGIIIGTLTYIATTGWTTTNLQNALNNQNPAPHDVVTLLIGVNDQYQTRDTAGYRQRFTVLLQRSIELARGKKENVVVLSIPDYSVTPFASSNDTARIRRELDLFNAINKEITLSCRISYLDITPSTREARSNPALIATDGLHPSGLEYRKWAERLGPLLEPVLK
ncbi:SGNH/GDSL hydrolase family protein [Lacibacter sp. MH-610]|uniref:SGNH/GDSL hydrolase family protein n=1 Tax=Lacibacter sp. MH-610 TaxID=3020883 RepID=UPI0038918AF9